VCGDRRGSIGLAHIEGFKKHPKAEVVGVAEVNPQRRQEAAEKHKLSVAVEDYHELLKTRALTSSSIALPNYLHTSVTIQAIKAGKHVMLDKPMATNARDAQKMIDAWKEKKVVFMVGQNFPLQPRDADGAGIRQER